jgi:hypothetical protein
MKRVYCFELFVPLTYKDVVVENEEVELDDDEVTFIRTLVRNCRNKQYGLMRILQDGAPELYVKLWNAIEQPLRRIIIEDGRKNGFVDEDNDDGGLDMDCVDYICAIPDFLK